MSRDAASRIGNVAQKNVATLYARAKGDTSGRLGLLDRGLLEHELHLVVLVEVDQHLAARHEPTEQQPLGERLAGGEPALRPPHRADRTAARRRAPCGSCPG